MADYERYGDYNRAEDEPDEGPAPSRGWIIFKKLLRYLVICVLLGTCLIIAFRMILSGYYPDIAEDLFPTDSLRAFSREHEIRAETQNIRVPFEGEIIEIGEGEEATPGKSQNGYFTADNLILVRDAGALQCSVRLNRQAITDIADAYGIENFSFGQDAFRFVLVTSEGNRYETSAVLTDSVLLYHYVKVCFDGVDFRDAAWMRLEITVPAAPEAPAFGICVYENNETYSSFSEYRLGKSERF